MDLRKEKRVAKDVAFLKGRISAAGPVAWRFIVQPWNQLYSYVCISVHKLRDTEPCSGRVRMAAIVTPVAGFLAQGGLIGPVVPSKATELQLGECFILRVPAGHKGCSWTLMFFAQSLAELIP